MDEFEKIKTFSESLVERQQKIDEGTQTPKADVDFPQYLSQFRAVPVQEEKESKRLLWIVLSLCIVVAGSTIFALVKRLPEMEETEIVVISPTPTPVKVLPENPGGLNIPDRDKVVYNRMTEATPTPVVETLFPEVEQPVIPEDVIEPENKEDVVAPVLEEVVPAPDEGTAVLQEIVPVEEPVMPTEEPMVPEHTEEVQETALMPPQEKPAEVQKTEPAESAPAKTQEPVKAKGPIWRAQLLSSASKEKVESSWRQISKQQAALLSDMPYQIISATIPGKGTFWRLQVGEFSNKEMVVNLCAKLKKKKQECIPVK